MDFRVLGPLEVTAGGRTLDLGAAKQRALLAVLLLHPNQAVSATRLIDELWGESPIASAAKVVQGYVSGLRKVLGAEVIVTTAGGYLVRLDPRQLDSARFEALAAEGQACLQDDPARAGELLREALALWRGRPLEGVVLESVGSSEAERLEELRLAALEQRIEADLALGRDGLVGELQALVDAHPYRERMRAHLMLALYRSGRQAEALAAYRETRTLLADELGLEPSAELQRLERQMLVQAPELDTPARPAAAAPPPPRRREPAASARRLVSVVVATIAESSALAERLDPESLHGVLDRCSEIWAVALERHGGTIERHLGDGVVGIFGLAESHEDDPLRAVRAATEMRDAAAEIGDQLERDHGARVGLRLGIDSGHVFVADDPRRGTVAAGDAIALAEGLAQIGAGGEILLGARAFALLERIVRAEPLSPFAVEGRAAAVRAWRLEGLTDDAPVLVRVHAPPFVGRERELGELRQALSAVATSSTCHLATIVGAAGLGKSRLAEELAAEIGDRATVVVGRCPPYGDGLAYRPLEEMVRQLGDGDRSPGIAGLVEGDDRAASIVRRCRARSGRPTSPPRRRRRPGRSAGSSRASRASAPSSRSSTTSTGPSPTLLDLLEYVVAFSSDAPILIALPRPAGAPGGPPLVGGAAAEAIQLVALEALPDAQARALVGGPGGAVAGAHRPGSSRGPTATRCSSSSSSPPRSTARRRPFRRRLHAVLAARIDRLEPGERILLAPRRGRGPQLPRRRARRAPSRGRGDAPAGAGARQLIQPDRTELAGEDAFRFTHGLIRDAAYEGMPKQLRAELHERVARWTAQRPAHQDEIVGFHLERAYRSRVELAPARRARAGAGARGVGAPGGRGADRARSAATRPPAHGCWSGPRRSWRRRTPRVARSCRELGGALFDAGRLADADRVLAEAIELAAAAGDAALGARARVERGSCGSSPTPDTRSGDVRKDRARRAGRARTRAATTSASAGPGACAPWRSGPRARRAPPTTRGGGPPTTPGERTTGASCSRRCAGAPPPRSSGRRRCRRRSAAARRSATRSTAAPSRSP